jgi:universal stress protein E
VSNEIRSILAAVARDARQAKQVVAKAVALAHLTGARLELFMCDAEAAFNRQHQYEPEVAARAMRQCLMESRRHLEALRRDVAASDVEVSLSVACESPLYESIVHAVECSHPDLVIRGVRRGAPLEPNDWELVRACPVPLLLTRCEQWKARPVMAAAIDVSPGESAELTRAILRAAAGLAEAMRGTVEIMHAARPDVALTATGDCRRALAERAREAGLQGAECHLVAGEPAYALLELATRRNFDLIVLGALTHRKTLAALVGTLTGRLIETLDTDFLLVKPAPTGMKAPSAPHARVAPSI